MKALREIRPACERTLLGAQAREHLPHRCSTIGVARRHEHSITGFSCSFQQIRRVARHHYCPALVLFLRQHTVFAYRDRCALLGAEAHGDDRRSGFRGASRFSQHFVGLFESFAITHDDDRALGLRLGQCEQVVRLAQGARD